MPKTKNHTRGVLFVLAGLLLTVAAYCQQLKRTRTATIQAKSLEFDWDSNVLEFTGNCKLTIGGDYNATMTAPAMTVKITGQPASVQSLVAKGPVSFVIITRPDSKGVRRKINASARDQAVYSEPTQTVKLVGGAQADMLPTDNAETTEAVHFTGQTITANLKTSRLSVDDANLTIKTRLQ